MPVLALGTGAYKRSGAFLPEVVLRNVLLEPEKLGISPDKIVRVTRPGLAPRYVFGGPVRGMFGQTGVLGGALLTVAGPMLYSDAAAVGPIDGTAPVSFGATQFGVFVCNGTALWFYDGLTLVAIAIPDDRIVTDVDTVANYAVLGCDDGRFYWILPGETTIDPLNFATAESAPDGLVGVRRVGDEVWLFGKTTVEPWQLTGDLDAPFQRATGRQYDRGCVSGATVRRYDNSVLWAGDDNVVYRGAAVPTRVSDHGIEERLTKASAPPTAWVLETEGHKLYVLDIPGQGTFVFDIASGEWGEFNTGTGVGWRAHTGISTTFGSFAGDRTGGAVWRVDGAADDDGTPIVSVVSGFAPSTSRPPRVDSFSVGVGVASDTTLSIRWKDGQDDYPAFPEVVEARAPFDVVNIYRLGSVDHPGRMFEVSCSTRCSFYGAMVNEAWQ